MIFHLRSGFADQLNHLEEGALQEHWFRSSVSSLIPDYPPETEHEVFFQAADPHTFQGDELGFHGLTLAALDAAPAVPMPFSWRLLYDGNTHLLYDNAQGETWKIMRWQGNSGGFFYLDQSGKKHRQWPPDADSPQLPQAIQLSGQRRQQAFTWLVTIPGRKTPPTDLRLEPIF